MRTKPKVKDRAFQILKEKGPDAAATAIAAILSDEGYGDINPVTIRAWKSRYNWDIGLPEIIEKIPISPTKIVTQQRADSLLTMGIELGGDVPKAPSECPPIPLT